MLLEQLLTFQRSTQIQPPVNGRKLWRVKRSASTNNNTQLRTSKADAKSSIECLQNSLKISAAGNQYLIKKSPMRRPKNKPGMPKNFVFVDLSPVINDDSSSDKENDKNASSEEEKYTVLSQDLNDHSYFDLSAANDSFLSLNSDDESIFSSIETSSILSNSSFDTPNYMQSQTQNSNTQVNTQVNDSDSMLGLGIMNMDLTTDAGHWQSNELSFSEPNYNPQPVISYNSNINPYPAMEQPHPEFSDAHYLQRANSLPVIPSQQVIESPIKENVASISHKRSKSAVESSRKRSGSTFQFKAYKGPSSPSQKKISKPQLRHRHTVSEPVKFVPNQNQNTELDDFVMLNNQISVPLNNDDLSSETSSLSNDSGSFTPNTDYSETEEDTTVMSKSVCLDYSIFNNCETNNFLAQNEFDLKNFVSF